MQAAKTESGPAPLSLKEAERDLQRVPKWKLLGNKIEREFKFKDFRQAMRFVDQVAQLANELDHHPDMYISYSKVKLDLSTHKIGGLSPNDFQFAERVDRLT